MPAIEYPKMLFHPEHGSKTVHTKEQQDALGSEWLESHAEAKELKEQQDAEKAEKANQKKGGVK